MMSFLINDMMQVYQKFQSIIGDKIVRCDCMMRKEHVHQIDVVYTEHSINQSVKKCLS